MSKPSVLYVCIHNAGRSQMAAVSAEQPKILTSEAVEASDVVVTMGCGDTCPYYPGKRYEDWELADPAGKGVDSVRPIRDEIKQRVLKLLDSLDVEPVTG